MLKKKKSAMMQQNIEHANPETFKTIRIYKESIIARYRIASFRDFEIHKRLSIEEHKQLSKGRKRR